MAEIATKVKFLEEGKKEFLDKGYKEASLRQICKNLDLTLGAFYGYFTSKEDLFHAIVSRPAEELLKYYKSTHENYLSSNPEFQKNNLNEIPHRALRNMIDFMFDYYEEFKLVFCKSAGTKYEDYLEEFIKTEVESTLRFIKTMKENHFFDVELDEQLIHILSSMLMKGIIEIFEHDMEYEHAVKYVLKLQMFYTAGWMKLFEG